MRQPSPETLLLVQYLRDCAARGEAATFKGMTEHVGGMDIYRRHRGRLDKALRIARERYGCVFESQPGVGYNPIQLGSIAVKVTQKRQGRINQQTGEWDAELKTIDPRKLTGTQLKEYLACRLKLEGQHLINGARAQAKLEQAAEAKLPRYTGLEFAKEAAIALRDVS